MTKEEAIDIIKCLAWHTRPNEEDVEQAIKALEQEPCEDAINREDAINKIEEWADGFEDGEYFSGKSVADAIRACGGIVAELPSVTPTRKKGKWIKSNIGGARVCSNCQAHMGLSNFKFCPNCGAEIEVEE